MLRIGYLADGPWAHAALERLLQDEEVSVAFIVPRFSSQDPILREMAASAGIDFVVLQNINKRESLDLLSSYDPDLLVSMSFDQIFRAETIELTPHGTINCHAGALPYYRGRNVLNWALINDERQFGVTVHYVDEGIDTGDIIVRRFGDISDEDTYSTLLGKAVDICADALHEAIDQIRRGTVTRTPQSSIDPVGFYTGRRRAGDEWIDWNWSSRRIFNFVRAIAKPGPCAQTAMDGHILRVVRAQPIPSSPAYIATVGEVVGRDGNVVIVKTGDSTIALTEIEHDGLPKLRVGSRMQSQHEFRQQVLEKRLSELEAPPN